MVPNAFFSFLSAPNLRTPILLGGHVRFIASIEAAKLKEQEK
jgi:hypothetical protein